jgi:hypothetical protein
MLKKKLMGITIIINEGHARVISRSTPSTEGGSRKTSQMNNMTFRELIQTF